MGVSEEMGDLRAKGSSDQEIISRLKGKGFAPKDIDDALNREKIRSAVSAGTKEPGGDMQQSIMRPENPRALALPTEGIAPTEEDLTPPVPIIPKERDYSPKTKDISEENYIPQSQEENYIPTPQEYSTTQEYAPQEVYDEYNPGMGITNTDTIIEISEQVFSEKIKTIQKQVENTNEFRTLAEIKIDHISERLKRIETVIDKLQAAILEKIGTYGRGLEGIKKEMSMMEDSFGKMVGNLAGKSHQPKHTHHMTKRKTAHKLAKKISKKR